MNKLNFEKKWTIPELSKMVKAILYEDELRYKFQPGNRNNYVKHLQRKVTYHNNTLVRDLISKLIALTDYTEPQFGNVSKKLQSKSITERLTILIRLYGNKIKDIHNSYINYIDVYNYLGILAFLCLNSNMSVFYGELNQYIQNIKNLNDNKGKNILLMFLYKLIKYNEQANKVKNFINYFTIHYDSFLRSYKEYLYQCDKSFFTKNKFNSLMNNSSNIKKLVNANTKSESNLKLAKNKAIENAKLQRTKDIENAKLQKAEANKKIKQNQNNKCTHDWKEYNNYKKEHRWTYKLRGPKKPECIKSLPASKKNLSQPRNRSNTLNTTASTIPNMIHPIQ